MQTARLIMRHAVVSLAFVALYLLLNRPEVILLSRIGFVAWYPASGLVMALMLGISPWYAILCCFADVLASRLIYGQSVFLISNAGSAMGVCALYGGAAYVLRGPLRINRSLARRRDVVRYVLVSATAAIAAMLVGVTALFADHLIAPGDYKASAVGWFLGDTIGLMGIAPFLLVHVFPHVRRWLTGVRVASEERTTRTRPAPVWAFVEGCGQILAILVVLWVMFGTAAGRYDHFYFLSRWSGLRSDMECGELSLDC